MVTASRGVVVGRDGRRGSEKFNDEVVRCSWAAGAVVYEMPSALPTPLVAYCVKALHAAAGIMITASHNPPEDNGYKLYAGDGAQIVPPDDEIVERHMRDASSAELGDRTSSLHSYVPESVLEEYRRHVVERFHPSDESDLAITYSPLHGVGGATMMRLFGDAGFSNVATVTRQFEPDGSFPTLAFPNPEEPGALDLAIETATAANSTVIIANDPDADRLGRGGARRRRMARVARRRDWLAARLVADRGSPRSRGERGHDHRVIDAAGQDGPAPTTCAYVTTLTGFKWLARSAGEGTLGFAYEEALGFAVDSNVSDKDGMSAALALATLTNDLAQRGSSLLERLDEIETVYGVHATTQLSIRADGPGRARATASKDDGPDRSPAPRIGRSERHRGERPGPRVSRSLAH